MRETDLLLRKLSKMDRLRSAWRTENVFHRPIELLKHPQNVLDCYFCITWISDGFERSFFLAW